MTPDPAEVVAERQRAYGHPSDNLGRTAALWDAYLSGLDRQLEAADVAAMMVLLKVARLAFTPVHVDSWVDIQGYARCGLEVTRHDP